MPSALQKLSKDLIVYSVLLADYEKLDFKDDALAGVRANYFNSKRVAQSDKTEIELDGHRLRFRYEMKTGKPLSWKIGGINQPYQTVTRGAGGSYCVLCYTDNGTVWKRAYFDGTHVWLRTEYYSRDRRAVIFHSSWKSITPTVRKPFPISSRPCRGRTCPARR